MSISYPAPAVPIIFQRNATRILAWPPVRQCASTATASPAMRLAENLPPSTIGRTASMTARTLPSLIAAVPSDAGAAAEFLTPGALRLELATRFPAQDQGR